MRTASRVLLLIFAFSIPWEYSLDLGSPFGNIARIAGLFVLAAGALTVLLSRQMHPPGALQVLAGALFLWMCSTCLWSIDPETTLERLPGYAQELMIVWLAWELVETADDLRGLLRAWLAGCWILAGLTVASLVLFRFTSGAQVRFAAVGQDPNDAARFLDLGLPVAALLADWERRRWGRLLALLYLPAGLAAVLLTASRGGFLAGLVALAGCAVLLWRSHRAVVLTGLLAAPLAAGAVWLMIPQGTLERIATIVDQAQGGDLNQRVNIWEAGWHAFQQAPFLGHGAGSFVSAAGLSPIDTAHNTALSVLVEGGVVGLTLGMAILTAVAYTAFKTRGVLRIALVTLLAVWCVASMVGTTGESRSTWLLFAVTALACRLAEEEPQAFRIPVPPSGDGAVAHLARVTP